MKYDKSELIRLSLKYLNAIPDEVSRVPSYDEFAKLSEQDFDELLNTWAVDINVATELKDVWVNHPSKRKLFAFLWYLFDDILILSCLNSEE